MQVEITTPRGPMPRRDRETAFREWADLFVLDVSEYPEAYKPFVRNNPRDVARDMADGMTVAEVRQLTRELRAERRLVAKLTR